MSRYRKHEAREWGRQHLRGVANVVIPSYTQDLKGLNEKGIRHDIRKEIEFGFAGTLLVSEVNITIEEYRQFFEWSNDEANGRLMLIHHAAFDHLEENIEAVRIAEQNGAELILLSYPSNMYASRRRISTSIRRVSATQLRWRSCCSRSRCGDSIAFISRILKPRSFVALSTNVQISLPSKLKAVCRASCIGSSAIDYLERKWWSAIRLKKT